MKNVKLIPVVLLAFISMPVLADEVEFGDRTEIRIDLDRDGKADLVQIVTDSEKNSQLEVSLSSGAKKMTYAVLKKSIEFRDPEKNSACDTDFASSYDLKAGKNGTFILTEGTADIEACAGGGSREFTIALSRGELIVTGLRTVSNSWSMGDPSPVVNVAYNFAKRKVSGLYYDRHDTKGKSHSRLELPASCQRVTLRAFERASYPSCTDAARNVLKKELGGDCGRNENSNICPWTGSIYDNEQGK